MIITRIETIIAPEHPQMMWIRVHTDEGIAGLGETTPRTASIRAVIHDVLAGMLIGRNPLDIEGLWQDMFQALSYHGYAGSEMRAISGIDIALWDILGQVARLPVYRLLGGRCRDAVPIYNTCVSHGPYNDREMFLENPGELAKQLLAENIRAMKIWPFDEFSVSTRGQSISADDLERGVSVIRSIREAVGDQMEIALEGHSCWNLPAAVKIARALEPYRLMWLEDMIPVHNAAALAQLRQATSTPLCVSERLFTRYQFVPVLEQRAADIIMPDICWVGGISEIVRIAAMAEAYQLPIAPHNCGGPVQTMAYAHVCTRLANVMTLETVRSFYKTYYGDIVTHVPRIEDGHLIAEDRPGLGTALKPEFLRRNDLSVVVSEEGESVNPWASGDPWKGDLGNKF